MKRTKPEFKVSPWPELRGPDGPIYYHDDEIQPPFLTSINVNNDDYNSNNNKIQLTMVSSDGRKLSYKYNGSPAEAITAALEAEGRL